MNSEVYFKRAYGFYAAKICIYFWINKFFDICGYKIISGASGTPEIKGEQCECQAGKSVRNSDSKLGVKVPVPMAARISANVQKRPPASSADGHGSSATVVR